MIALGEYLENNREEDTGQLRGDGHCCHKEWKLKKSDNLIDETVLKDVNQDGHQHILRFKLRYANQRRIM
jgi:hypothetical protein